MFGFLKDKLKSAISKFTKSDEEEPLEEVREEEKTEVKEEPKAIEKPVEKAKKQEKTEVKEEPKEIEKPVEELDKVEEIKQDNKIHGVKITYFVHGTTTDNEKDLATGWEHGELSEIGLKQAEELGKQVSDKKFDIVFCSDLKRAVDSTNLAFKDKYEIIQDKRLREVNYGDFTQKPSSEFKSNMIDYIDKTFPSGESYKDVEIRIAAFLNYLYDNYFGKHVAIVSHQAPQLALDVVLKEKSWEKSIKEDWRLHKKWQPGWEYFIKKKIDVTDNLIKKEEQILKQEKEIIEEEKKLEEPILKKDEKTEVESEVEEILKEEKEKKLEAERIDLEKEVEEVEEKKGFFGIFKGKKAEKEHIKETISEQLIEEKQELSVETEEKKGFFKKVSEGITTKKIDEKKFEDLFYDMELALLENNVAVEIIDKIKKDLGGNIVNKPLTRTKIAEIIKDTLKNSIKEILEVDKINLLEKIKSKKPYVICFVGINGSGKTTTIAKITNLLLKNNLSVVLAASDTFRAAAIDQLQHHADKLGVKLIKQDYGADPAAVAFDAIKHAGAKNIDVVLIDTAGRMHSNHNLIDEMKKIIRVARPDLKIFVGESITGNDCIEQAKQFNESIDIDGIILSKADIDEKGGAALSVSYITKKPIIYLGVGQEYEDIQEFSSEKIIENLGI